MIYSLDVGFALVLDILWSAGLFGLFTGLFLSFLGKKD